MASVHDELFSVSAAPILQEHFGVSVTYDGIALKAAVGAEEIIDEDDGRRIKRRYRRLVTVYRTSTSPATFYPNKTVTIDGVEYSVFEVPATSQHVSVLDVRRNAAVERHGEGFRKER